MLELKKASFRYGDREILREINLHLSPGSFHFLTGPSGSGKTTLMKLCYLDLFPMAGTVHAFGKDVRAMERDDIRDTVADDIRKIVG